MSHPNVARVSPRADESADFFAPAGESGRRAKLRSVPPAAEGSRPNGATQATADERDRRPMMMPPIARVSMAPRELERNPFRRYCRKLAEKGAAKSDGDRQRYQTERAAPWRRKASRRRLFLLLLVVAQTALASWSLARTFPWPEHDYLEVAIIATFAVLFSWISFAFWSNVAGFCALWRSGRILGPEHGTPDDRPLHTRTALLMPICNEEVGRCFAGVEAMYRSLAQTGELDHFDFYILSDTGEPRRQAEEELAWAKICRAVDGFGKIFYRRRRVNIKRKSGNIGDFLRRWSRHYDHMIVLDADSLMSGAAVVRLARLMEASPSAGIIQTIPTIVNGESLFARVQQFASRVYGPLFSASLHFWQLGESTYWGHNAIIRIGPFVEHCGLARLPGRAPLGGEILSHDFVEAALIGRAGWEVWLALDVPGSYEESPPNLLDELKRDRRWCQGNLQHLRVVFGDGLKTGHRAVLAIGVMAYASAFFWAGFLILNTIQLATQSWTVPVYFTAEPSLFPVWPRWNPEWAIALASTTLLLLFLPKLLSFILIVRRGAAPFGGAVRLAIGVVLEIVLSTLVAPLRMWFHCKFVVMTLLGKTINWNTQQRMASGTRWSEAWRAHGVATVVASGWLAAVSWTNPVVFVWLLPVAIPLLLSIPLSVWSSRVTIGSASRLWRLFQVPEDENPPPMIAELRAALDERSLHNAGPNVSAQAAPSPAALHVAQERAHPVPAQPALAE
jgi:membrane glycosyltransferase